MKPLARRLRSLRNEAEAILLRHQRELALAALVDEVALIVEQYDALDWSHRRVLAYLPVGATLWMRHNQHSEWTRYRFEGLVPRKRALVFIRAKLPWQSWYSPSPRLFAVGLFLQRLCADNVLVERGA